MDKAPAHGSVEIGIAAPEIAEPAIDEVLVKERG
jgi:hypothetical protein